MRDDRGRRGVSGGEVKHRRFFLSLWGILIKNRTDEHSYGMARGESKRKVL